VQSDKGSLKGVFEFGAKNCPRAYGNPALPASKEEKHRRRRRRNKCQRRKVVESLHFKDLWSLVCLKFEIAAVCLTKRWEKRIEGRKERRKGGESKQTAAAKGLKHIVKTASDN
jgi:hypothetical protein